MENCREREITTRIYLITAAYKNNKLFHSNENPPLRSIKSKEKKKCSVFLDAGLGIWVKVWKKKWVTWWFELKKSLRNKKRTVCIRGWYRYQVSQAFLGIGDRYRVSVTGIGYRYCGWKVCWGIGYQVSDTCDFFRLSTRNRVSDT